MSDLSGTLERVLDAFGVYYNVKRDDVTEPFAAEAEFSLHDEQYFLVRSARLGESDSREYVYFATEEHLDQPRLEALDAIAWQHGLSRVTPHENHRNTDIVLIILARHMDQEAASLIPRLRRTKLYRFGLQGCSHYRLVAGELSTGRLVCNRQGRDLGKLIRNIIQSKERSKEE